jgi:hypothetical protein
LTTKRPSRVPKDKDFPAISATSGAEVEIRNQNHSDSPRFWQVGEPEPSRPLGVHGRALWIAIQTEYRINDSPGRELLQLACEALDRAQQLADAVAADGVVVRTARGEVRTHPAVKEELACRAFTAKALSRLGLDVEPSRPAGRPLRGGLGVKHHAT